MNLPARGAAVFLLASCLTSCGADKAPEPGEEVRQESLAYEGLIAAVGDSLTAGLGLREEQAWPALVERRLREEGYNWKVLNAGVSGETSSGARGRMTWVLRMKPDIVVLETGANDGLRGLPADLLRENIDAILDMLEEKGVIVVLAGMQMVTNLGEDYTREFARVYGDLAAEHGLAIIPFFLEGVAGKPELNQADGIHPTAEGQRVIMETAYPYIIEAVRKSRNADNGVNP